MLNICLYSLDTIRSYLCGKQVECTEGRQLSNLVKMSIFTKSSVNTAHAKQYANGNSNATLKITFLKTNTLTFAHAKLLEFHILELKILNSLIQYKFLTYEHFPCCGLPHVILTPTTDIKVRILTQALETIGCSQRTVG